MRYIDFKLEFKERAVLGTGLYWGIACTEGWPAMGSSMYRELVYTGDWGLHWELTFSVFTLRDGHWQF